MANQWTWAGDVAVGTNLMVSGTAAFAGAASFTPVLSGTIVSISQVDEDPSFNVTLTVTGNPYVAGDKVYLIGLTTAFWLNNLVVTLTAGSNATTMLFVDPTGSGATPSDPLPDPETGTAQGANTLGVGLSVTGDITGTNDIADFYVNGSVTPAVVLDGSGGVTLNGGNITLLTTSPSTNIALTNTTAATASVAQFSPIINLTGNNWTGAATPDTWSIQVEEFILGVEGMSVLSLTQSGVSNSFGIVATAIPAPASFNGHTAGTNYNVPSLIFGTPTVTGINYGFDLQSPDIFAIGAVFHVGNPNNTLGSGAHMEFEIDLANPVDINGQAYVRLISSQQNTVVQGTATRLTSQGQPSGDGAGLIIDTAPVGNTSGNAYGIVLGGPTLVSNWFGNALPIEWGPTSGAGTFTHVGINAAVNASGGASGAYTALNVSVQEVVLTSAPTNYLLSLNAGVAGTTNKALVDSTGTMSLAGGLATNIVTKSTTYVATSTDHTINCTGTFTLTLPTTGLYVGQEYYIKNIGTGTITVSSSVNIDFSLTQSLPTQGESITVQWDGTQYWIY